jgi:hypothetical protein
VRVQNSFIIIQTFPKPVPPGLFPPYFVADAGRTTATSSSGMPFMDDVLLWCPEAETKIDDFTECLVSLVKFK